MDHITTWADSMEASAMRSRRCMGLGVVRYLEETDGTQEAASSIPRF